MFLGIKPDVGGGGGTEERPGLESIYEEADDGQEEEKVFHNMMESIGANRVFEE